MRNRAAPVRKRFPVGSFFCPLRPPMVIQTSHFKGLIARLSPHRDALVGARQPRRSSATTVQLGHRDARAIRGSRRVCCSGLCRVFRCAPGP